MKSSGELELLKDIKRRVMINALKDMVKDKKGIGLAAVMLLYTLIFYFLFSDMWVALTIGIEDLLVFYTAGVMMCVFIALMMGTFIFILQKYEIEFLLPLPIKKKNIFRQKFLRSYKGALIVPVIFALLFHHMIRDSPKASVFLTMRLFVGLFLATSVAYLFCIYLVAVYNQIFNKKKKLLVQGIFAFILISGLGELWYWLMSSGGPWNGSFLDMIYWPPINLFIGPVYLSTILGVSGGLLPFLISLSFFAVGNIVLFHLVWNLDHQVYEDNYQMVMAQRIEPLSIERSSKEMWWRKYLIPETPFSYLDFKKGTGVLFEKKVLSSMRGVGDFIGPYIMFVVTLLVTPIFTSDEMIYIFLLFVLTVGLANVVMNVNILELRCFYIDRTIPWNLNKLAFYSGLSKLFFSVLCYEGWLVYTVFIGLTNSIQMFIVYAIMGPTVLFMEIYANQFGFLWASTPEDFEQENFKIGSVWGSAMFFILSLLLILITHSYVTTLIDNALKFVLIVPMGLGIGYLFIRLYDREWKFLTVKKRKTSIRKMGAASVSILLLIGLFGGFFYYIDSMPPSYDMRIDEEMVMANETFYFDDNIYITEGGSLTVKNATMVFNTSADDAFGIYLDEDGLLSITNSTLKGNNEKFGVRIVLKGEATIKNSTFTKVWGDVNDENGEGGVELHNDDISIENVTIDGGITNGFYIEGCSPYIINATISGCGDDGIEIKDGTPVIEDTWITNNSWGVVMFDSESPQFHNCKISYNENEGVYCRNSSPEFYGCEISYNGGYGLELRRSDYISENTDIRFNDGGNVEDG